MRPIALLSNREVDMGCCDNNECSDKSAKRKSIPWLALVIGVLVLLSLYYWQ
ncbi:MULTISPECIES: hypothetical protein [Vibrio]|uniref:Uncharacterized protein n=1 Tax=Vibrio chanodichtyis TaxID=3027932 RepID=A0ABT5V397_9VIBR|nr:MULTISPECIES: hypothetical protein [Vibrio]MDE1514785.1 hypothetical protein [Vibrio chanodichtyis]